MVTSQWRRLSPEQGGDSPAARGSPGGDTNRRTPLRTPDLLDDVEVVERRLAVQEAGHRWYAPFVSGRRRTPATPRSDWAVVIGCGALLLVALMFLAANMTKLAHGAWLPLLIAVIAFTVMTTWQRGRQVVTRAGEQAEGPLPEFVDGLADCQPLLRIPGTAVFLNRGKQTAPLAMRANVKHNYALHEHVVIVPIDTVPVPRVPDSERTEVDPLGLAKDGIFHVTTHFGYMETPNVRRTPPARPDPDRRPDRRRRGILFPIQARADEGDGTDHGALAQSTCSSPMPPTTSACPPERTVIMGSRIEV